MTITDISLIAIIAIAILFIIYNNFILNFIYGKTKLKVSMYRQNKIDWLIFFSLLIIFFYKKMTIDNNIITFILILTLIFIMLYLIYIFRFQILFKKKGFFYGSLFIKYADIKNIKLSEDGFLVFFLEKKCLFVKINKLENLKDIFTGLKLNYH